MMREYETGLRSWQCHACPIAGKLWRARSSKTGRNHFPGPAKSAWNKSGPVYRDCTKWESGHVGFHQRAISRVLPGSPARDAEARARDL